MGVGVEDISMVGDVVGIFGEGLVYCSQPTNARERMMIIKIRLNTTPERGLCDLVILPVLPQKYRLRVWLAVPQDKITSLLV